MLTPKNKAKLKALANSLSPSVTLGKGFLNENILKAINDGLEANELIKVKILNTQAEEKDELAEEIVRGTGAELVAIIGHVIILYRVSRKHHKIDL